MDKILGASWIPKLIGIIIILGTVAHCYQQHMVNAQFDLWSCIMGSITGAGLMSAKQTNVSNSPTPLTTAKAVEIPK